MKMCRLFWSLFWLFIAGTASTVVYLLYFEPPFLKYQGLPFKVEGPARPGESVRLIVTRCNISDRMQDYELSHWLERVGSADSPTVLPTTPVPPIKPGCQTGKSAANVIPAGTLPGWYRVGGAGKAKGVLRTVAVEWYSEPFEVIQ